MKKQKGGEDAWVASNNLIVICDGVSGWAYQGIDSGVYSKTLVSSIKQKFDQDPSQELKQVLVDSVKDNKYKGSTTCVLAKFDTGRENVIKTTNLGDSGYLILRPSTAKDGQIVLLFRSKE